jgi:hypothetical protein
VYNQTGCLNEGFDRAAMISLFSGNMVDEMGEIAGVEGFVDIVHLATLVFIIVVVGHCLLHLRCQR